ncbi:MAG: hypothetical protein ABL970_12180 [Nitrospira sp.]
MSVPKLLAVILLLAIPSWAAETDVFPDLDLNNPSALQEASRALEEELKLAARPQTYLLVDLVAGVIQIKARGVDLHRLPIAAWSVTDRERLTGAFRLVARPPVVRRKVDPAATTEQEPISLSDMPTSYRLSFSPAMTMDIIPLAEAGAMGWVYSTGQKAWKQLQAWKQSLDSNPSSAESPLISLTLSSDQAQSLAWSTVDGMSVVIRRPSE